MKIKTSELTGAALDWAVEWSQSLKDLLASKGSKSTYSPSTDWSQGGPIIERERLTVMYDDDWKFDPTDPEDNGERWMANTNDVYYEPTAYGPTPLIAAMRCHVASELGDEVEIPEELTNVRN